MNYSSLVKKLKSAKVLLLMVAMGFLVSQVSNTYITVKNQSYNYVLEDNADSDEFDADKNCTIAGIEFFVLHQFRIIANKPYSFHQVWVSNTPIHKLKQVFII